MNDTFQPDKFNEVVEGYKKEVEQDKPDISTLEEFEITDGKDRSQDEIQKLKDLEEILGVKQVNAYGTLDRGIFKERLLDMGTSELQSLAMQVGFPPTRDRVALRKGLEKSFDAYLKSHSVGAVFQAKPVFDQNSPNYKEAVKLFAE
jgi:hypothetical protein